MDPIEILMNEHRRIESVMDALEVYAAKVANNADAPTEDLALFVRFLREYADAHHHAKEEDILFVAMGEAGIPTDGGPIGVMLREHDIGRALVDRLAAVAETKDWDDAARGEVLEAASGFTGVLRGHIQKEDNILYPMARVHVEEGAFRAVAQAVAAAEDSGAARAVEMITIADDLVRRYPAR